MVLPKSHDQCRGEMCWGFGVKTGSRKVSESLEVLIRKWAQPIWSRDVTSYPCGICNTCRRLLYKCESGDSSSSGGVIQGTDRWKTFKLENISNPCIIRASNCSCPICTARKSNIVGKKGYGGAKPMKRKIIDGSEITNKTPATATSHPCVKCLQQKTGRGILHPCTQARRKVNLAKLVINEGEIATQQVAAKLLQNTREKGNNFQLKQLRGGNDMRVKLGKQKKVYRIVDGLLVAKMKKGLDLSNRDISKVLKILRSGNVKVEPNVMNILEEVGSSLDEEYENIKMELEVNRESDDEKNEEDDNTKKKKKKSCSMIKEMNVAIAKNSRRLVEKVSEAQKLNMEKVKC